MYIADKRQIKEYLDSLNEKYNRPDFIKDDPISVPRRYERPEDIEIAGLLAATIAWGQRKTIVKNAHRMADLMDDAPYQFVMQAAESDMRPLDGFVHRTFNGADLRFFIGSLRNVYLEHGGLGGFFQSEYLEHGDLRPVISRFRRLFLGDSCQPRTSRHLSSIDKGSACKRLNMFLKWMVRDDGKGVDFGIWKDIPPSALYLPLDVHAGNTARALGLLTRRQDDWKAVEEATASLRDFDSEDPVKYDFALFCAGIDKLIK